MTLSDCLGFEAWPKFFLLRRGFTGLYQTSQLWSTRKSPTEQVITQLEMSHINNFAFLPFPISAGVSNIDKCQPYSLFCVASTEAKVKNGWSFDSNDW